VIPFEVELEWEFTIRDLRFGPEPKFKWHHPSARAVKTRERVVLTREPAKNIVPRIILMKHEQEEDEVSENLNEEAQILEQEEPEHAILFELEGIAINGRQILFDVIKGALTGKGVKLTPVLFARYCLDVPLQESVATLLKQVKKDMDEKIVATIIDAFNAAVLEKGTKLNSDLKNAMALAQEQGLRLGAVSCLKEATAESLAEKLGLTKMGVSVFANDVEGKLVPSADAWLKLTKQMEIGPPLCGSFVTSMKSSNAALSAGTKCVVVIDKYNGFQDFGGADYVVDALDNQMVKELIDLLRKD